MGEIFRYLLQKFRQEIINNVNVNDLLDDLYNNQILDLEEFNNIKAEPSGTRTSTFLDIFHYKTESQRESFIKLLNSLPYKHIYSELTDEKNHTNVIREIAGKAITTGGLPVVPDSFIERIQPRNLLKNLIQCLKINEILILFGFLLIGKSCLASQVLRDEFLVFKYLNNRIFWVNVSDIPEINNESKIKEHLERLILRIELMINPKYEPKTYQNFSLQSYKDILRSKCANFCEDGLLILDNVLASDVIEYFDVGMKLLVITSRKDVMKNDRAKVMDLKGFEYNETLDLFKKHFQGKTKKEFVPIIHSSLQGHPKLISLVILFLKENIQDIHNVERWTHIKNSITKESDFEQNLFHLLDYFLSLLPPPSLALLHHLVIFPADVNIPYAVLLLYHLPSQYPSPFHLEALTAPLLNVSLLERQYYHNSVNSDNDCVNSVKTGGYIYTVRNLVIKYLRVKLGEDRVREYHRRYVNEMMTRYGNVENLPKNNNYVYTYWGWHLAQSGDENELFSKFLELGFIGAKAKVTGFEDVLEDYTLYSGKITKDNSVLKNKLECYRRFLDKQDSHSFRTNDINLIQYALTEAHDDPVYKDAFTLARNSPEQLYFKWVCEKDCFSHTINIKDNFNSVCFANSARRILVGTTTGDIQLWDCKSDLKLETFSGHKAAVTKVKLSHCKKYFLSVSLDSTVKIWTTDHIFELFSDTDNPKSPSQRQSGHFAFFPPSTDETLMKPLHTITLSDNVTDTVTDSSSITDYITCATFSPPHSPHLAVITGSCKGKITTWHFDNTKVFVKNEQILKNQHIDTIAMDQTFIYVSVESSIYVFNPEVVGYLYMKPVGSVVREMLPISDRNYGSDNDSGGSERNVDLQQRDWAGYQGNWVGNEENSVGNLGNCGNRDGYQENKACYQGNESCNLESNSSNLVKRFYKNVAISTQVTEETDNIINNLANCSSNLENSVGDQGNNFNNQENKFCFNNLVTNNNETANSSSTTNNLGNGFNNKEKNDNQGNRTSNFARRSNNLKIQITNNMDLKSSKNNCLTNNSSNSNESNSSYGFYNLQTETETASDDINKTTSRCNVFKTGNSLNENRGSKSSNSSSASSTSSVRSASSASSTNSANSANSVNSANSAKSTSFARSTSCTSSTSSNSNSISTLVVISARYVTLIRFLTKLREGSVIVQGVVETSDGDKIAAPSTEGDFQCGVVTWDDRCLLTGSSDGVLRLWDLVGLGIIREFPTNTQLVIGVDTFHTNNSMYVLLSGNNDKTLKCWFMTSDRVLHSKKPKNTQLFATNFPYNTANKPLLAVVNTENNIQIYNLDSHSELLTTIDDIPAHSTITHLIFSQSGDFIIYALKSGCVYKFCIKTKDKSMILMGINSIVLLKSVYNDGILVQCCKGSLKIIQNDLHSKILLDSQKDENSLVIDAFALTNMPYKQKRQHFFIVESQIIYLINLDETVWINSKYRENLNSNIVECCMSEDCNYLGLLLADNSYQVVRVVVINNKLDYQLIFQNNFSREIVKSCLSFNGRFLALGCQDGKILSYDLANKKNEILKMHKEPLQYLRFSPDPTFVLVSVSDQICFWKLDENQKKTANNQLRLPVFCDIWSSKQPKNKEKNPFLLANIKLPNNVKKITANYDFTSFLTVDNSGEINIFNVIQ